MNATESLQLQVSTGINMTQLNWSLKHIHDLWVGNSQTLKLRVGVECGGKAATPVSNHHTPLEVTVSSFLSCRSWSLTLFIKFAPTLDGFFFHREYEAGHPFVGILRQIKYGHNSPSCLQAPCNTANNLLTLVSPCNVHFLFVTYWIYSQIISTLPSCYSWREVSHGGRRDKTSSSAILDSWFLWDTGRARVSDQPHWSTSERWHVGHSLSSSMMTTRTTS